MKHIIILGDGMANQKVASRGNKTILQCANTPYMDLLASQGRTGLLVLNSGSYEIGFSEVGVDSRSNATLNEHAVMAVLEALKHDNKVSLRIDAVCEEDALKIHAVEALDRCVVGPIYEAVRRSAEPVAIAVLTDYHSTDGCKTKAGGAIPFVIYKPGFEPYGAGCYDEFSCRNGIYGFLQGDEFLSEFLSD